MPLYGVQRVCSHIFPRYIPRVTAAIGVLMRFDTADADSFTLSQRIKTQTNVLTDDLIFRGFNIAWLIR